MLKKAIATFVSVMLMASVTFAQMPNNTIVYKDANKATGVDNFDGALLSEELYDANKADLFYKLNGIWYNIEDVSYEVDLDEIPQVNYHDKNGNITVYEKHDGEEITDSFYIKNID
ncbi:hypothetical protein WG909_07350 [Peptostreptococcaceae bacterium AGR-M142]